TANPSPMTRRPACSASTIRADGRHLSKAKRGTLERKPSAFQVSIEGRILSVWRLTLMCLVALVAAHAPGAAANLCTIDHVERTPVGVNVYFSATRILTIYHSGPKSRVVVAVPKGGDAVGGDRLGPFRGVALVVGDRVLIPLGDAYHP